MDEMVVLLNPWCLISRKRRKNYLVENKVGAETAMRIGWYLEETIE
jgi:hypothetical protein